MKQMQCNATPLLNIKTTAKQVWLYFICRTTTPGYVGTTTNPLIVLNTPKHPYLNQATKRYTCQISYPKKSRNRKFQTFDHPRHLKSVVPPPGINCSRIIENNFYWDPSETDFLLTLQQRKLRRSGEPSLKRPEGMHRELYALLYSDSR